MNSIYISHSPLSTVILNERGDLHQLYQDLDEVFIHGIKAVMTESNPEITTDSKHVSMFLRENGITCKMDLDNPLLREWRLNRFGKYLDQGGTIGSFEEYVSKLREGAINQAKSVIRASSGNRDELAAQIIHTIDELQKSLNSAAIRLSEMYSLHFPELVNNISNPVSLAKIIISNAERNTITRDLLEEYKLPLEKINAIMDSINDSLGGEMSKSDLEPIVQYAGSVINIATQLNELENWVDREMSSIAPNLAAVAGPNVSARLLAQFGSLENLAMKSASKIQMIGAEKALYSALKSRGSPPKHGIIFQIPEIGNSPYWIRGKLARSYAGKLAIAARLDYFKGEFLGDKYRTELRELEKHLREQYPKASDKKSTETKRDKGPPRRNKHRRARK